MRSDITIVEKGGDKNMFVGTLLWGDITTVPDYMIYLKFFSEESNSETSTNPPSSFSLFPDIG